MRTHTRFQTLTNVRLMISRYVWMLSLGLVIVVTALTVHTSKSAPAVLPDSASSSPTAHVDPAAQRVLDYLQAHHIVQWCPAPLDPVQQGVMDYLHAHGADLPCHTAATPLAPTVQAVLDYLHIHSR